MNEKGSGGSAGKEGSSVDLGTTISNTFDSVGGSKFLVLSSGQVIETTEAL